MAKDPTVKRVPGKQAGQRHMKKKEDKKYRAKSTMGTGKVTPGVKGAMGKNQDTGDGGASDW